MPFIVRRKDPPAYPGAKTYWETLARRTTLEEAKKAMAILKSYTKDNTVWWCGEETINAEPEEKQEE